MKIEKTNLKFCRLSTSTDSKAFSRKFSSNAFDKTRLKNQPNFKMKKKSEFSSSS